MDGQAGMKLVERIDDEAGGSIATMMDDHEGACVGLGGRASDSADLHTYYFCSCSYFTHTHISPEVFLIMLWC